MLYYCNRLADVHVDRCAVDKIYPRVTFHVLRDLVIIRDEELGFSMYISSFAAVSVSLLTASKAIAINHSGLIPAVVGSFLI